jgi:hypothetical protein
MQWTEVMRQEALLVQTERMTAVVYRVAEISVSEFVDVSIDERALVCPPPEIPLSAVSSRIFSARPWIASASANAHS